ncbi:MAG: valine--tRNA ligase [Defluviitaleaceae bacterium]|nr:valine--tRNA ligase [Defluviitaleaceae bacterium]
MNTDIPKHYDPSREDEIYTRWLEKGYFRASVNPDKKPYTIMIPPPNVTDKLHVGHAFNNTIQDALIRAKRMQGYEALWVPGTDHAAIATEVQVVKALAKEGISKKDLGREAFLARVWEWNDLYGGTIIGQQKKLGISCDWERERFTMDENLSDAVLETFERLYNEGKIYRGERLVNWCVTCQTTISDSEIEHEDGEGTLYHFKYPFTDGSGYITFATTRPETMLGDTAIAVHPEDERYANHLGKSVNVPLFGDKNPREIPLVKDTYVDPEYGTGAVKVTPAHDPNDFEIGERHNLPRVNIMNDDGTINENGGKYEGLPREEARVKIIKDMEALGLFIKEEKITHAKGTHDRCHKIVEPLIKLQWFVRMDELAKPALEVYNTNKVRFHRERYGRIYKHWLEIVRDWCISRQIWWGHRIPAYYCPSGHVTVSKTAPEQCAACGSASLTQDEDTLDTWFSSGIWPFSTLGWPQKTPELDYFYPTNTMVTAKEIIFNWVVRMVFMGLKFMDEIPFTDVLIHGTVLDANGKKMSKSLGNGIDPLEVVEKYGADVLRLAFLNGTAIENDTRFHWERVEFCRNFMNKLWNAARFVLMHTQDTPREVSPNNAEPEVTLLTSAPPATPAPSTRIIPVEDRWILSRVNHLTREVTEKFDSHDLGMATQKIVDFLWDEFCDWYVEIVKVRLRDEEEKPHALATLVRVFTTCLKLLHPVTPFITEDLFLALQTDEETIMRAPWPLYDPALPDPAAEKAMETLKEAVRGIRNIRAEKQVPPAQKITIRIQPNDKDAEDLFTQAKAFLALLCNASEVTLTPHNQPPAANENAVSLVVPSATLHLPLASLIDADKEKARLQKERKRLTQELERIDAKLSNEGYLSKAPANLIAAEREKRESYAAMLNKVENELKGTVN